MTLGGDNTSVGNPKRYWDRAEWTLDADEMRVKVVPGEWLFDRYPRSLAWCRNHAQFRSPSGAAIVAIPGDEVGDLVVNMRVPGELTLVLIEAARKGYTHVCFSSVHPFETVRRQDT